MLPPIVFSFFPFFFLRKIHPASLSILLGHEHNFERNAMILGVTLKSIMLKFSSIIYLTLFIGFSNPYVRTNVSSGYNLSF